MNKLANLLINNEITAEELANIPELIERAKLVQDGTEACKKTFLFPLGVSSIECYSYKGIAGEYQAWGTCDISGNFICYTNWGGNHKIGECNLTNPAEVFLAFENSEFANDLRRFLQQQIDEAAK